MKKLSKILFTILLILLLGHLYMPRLYPLGRHSKDIAESKKINAFVSECRIIKIDTLQSSYQFPDIRSIWIEYAWDDKRNKWGIIRPTVNFEWGKAIIFDFISTDDTFYSRFNNSWRIRKDSNDTGRSGYGNKYYLNCDHNKGDTIYIEIYRIISRKNEKEKEMPLYRFTVACE